MADKLREAAKAVEDAKEILFLPDMSVHVKTILLRLEDASNALKAALAEPEQEPVAWTTMPEAEDWCFVSSSKDPTGKLEGKWFPLYAAPPRREWVGLTAEDMADAHNSTSGDVMMRLAGFARAIEAKLREKNI